MKKLLYLLIITAIVPVSLCAQEYSLQKELNVPRTGDRFEKEEFEVPSAERSAVKTKGRKDLWDFNKTPKVEMEKTYTYVMEDGSVEKVVEVREVPWVTYLEGEGNQFTEYNYVGRNHYVFSGDSLYDYGRENSGSLIRYYQPGLVIRYPFDYGDRCVSSFSGKGLHWQRLESEHSGTITSHADGFGTLILPSGDTLTSIVRLHIHKEEFVRYTPAGLSPNIDRELKEKERKVTADAKAMPDRDFQLNVTDTYQWYQYGFRYPVFETVSSYTKVKEDILPHEPVSFVFYPSFQRELDTDIVNEAIEKQLTQRNASSGMAAFIDLQLSCYPNPVSDYLTLELQYNPGATTRISLYSPAGVLLYREIPKGDSGYYKTQIDMASFVKGAYLIHVQSGEEQITQKINK